MKARATWLAAAWVVTVSVVAATAFADPPKWGVGPTLVNDHNDDTKVGARFHLAWRSHTHDLSTRMAWSRDHRITAQYLWVPNDVAVPSQTEIALGFGASVSLSEPAPPASIDTPIDSLPSPYKYNYGLMGGRIHAQYEASADRSEHAMAGGAELFYSFVEKPWVPSLLFTYDAVKPLKSDVRDALALDEELYQRFMARAYWTVTVKRFTGEADASLFRSAGLDAALEALGWKSGEALELRVAMAIERTLLKPVMLDRVYLQYADGQMPTATAATNAWTLGVDFAVK